MNQAFVTISAETDETALARDIVEVHGTRAAAVARENARVAAIAGQPGLAKSWIRVLGAIQRQQANKPTALPIGS
jgi:CBS-domain-containing membrane protein